MKKEKMSLVTTESSWEHVDVEEKISTPLICRRRQMARSCSFWTPLLISLSPITGDSAKVSRRRVILATSVGSPQPLLEANIKEPQKLQVLDSKDVSRRNTMLYVTAGVLCGVNFLHGEAAEARVGRKENRRKALEKLRGRAKDSEPKSRDKKKELDAEVFPFLPPSLQPQALGPVVEANLLP